MDSTNIRQIKAALWDQAFVGRMHVHCALGQVMAIRRRKGHLQAMVRGWSRWHPVENVTIDILFALPCSSTRDVAGNKVHVRTGSLSTTCLI
ncbi:MAG: hypothetical protein NVS4B7_18640 [Ktedonobacteraceae bacterium]